MRATTRASNWQCRDCSEGDHHDRDNPYRSSRRPVEALTRRTGDHRPFTVPRPQTLTHRGVWDKIKTIKNDTGGAVQRPHYFMTLDIHEKTCPTCGVTSSIYNWQKDRTRRDGYNNVCRLCQNAKRLRLKRKASQAYYEAVEKAKSLGCKACGELEYCTLDLHHLRDKKFSIAEAIAHRHPGPKITIEELEVELKKCITLCANCHRKFHTGVLTL